MGEPSLPRRRKASKRFECGEGEAYHCSRVEENYRRQYFKVLDLAECSNTTCFDPLGYIIYTELETLLLKAAHRDNFSHEIDEVASMYKGNIDMSELLKQPEIHVLGISFSYEEQLKVIIHNVIKYLQSLFASLLKQVCRVGCLLLVMPAMNATGKQSSSVLRRLKSYLQSTS